MIRLSRRGFLRLAAGAVPAIAASTRATVALAASIVAPPAPLGRIATWSVDVRANAERRSALVRKLGRDDVVPLYAQLVGDPVTAYNAVWYRTDGGYVHSAWVQPVNSIANPVEPPGRGFWAEVTVPFADSRWTPKPGGVRYMRLYYSSVYRVVDLAQDDGGDWWYRLQHGLTWSPGAWAPAAQLRRLDPSELTPISPGKAKRIRVDLARQVVSAYEDGALVLSAPVATGYGPFRTPSGAHRMLFKRPASRMIGGSGEGYYDLPGVPFPSYFTAAGAAIHGAYWHNDFGHPRSHGCVNVMPEVAKWFWRWSEPAAPYDAAQYDSPRGAIGTEVHVV